VAARPPPEDSPGAGPGGALMLGNLLIGAGTMTLCLLLQSVLLVQAIRYYARRHNDLAVRASSWSTLLIINSVMLLLLLGNIAQVAIWALVFMWVDEFEAFREAVYHSAVNFATLGYGDIVMSERNRLLGPLEAINGALMIGVSTAALLATFQDAIKGFVRARQGADD
jgi:hypothetical protein